MEAFNTIIWDHVLEDIYSVKTHDPYIIDIVLTQSFQKLDKALQIYFQANIVELWFYKGHLGRSLTITKAYFNYSRIIVLKHIRV